jgi:Tol biopolymer transport system component
MDGGEPIQLTFFDSSESASPAWSPDGLQIAFLCNQGGSFKVWVVSAEGSTAREFERTNASDTNNGLSWFPSSDIVYRGYAEGVNHSGQTQEITISASSLVRSAARVSPEGLQALKIEGSGWKMELAGFEGAVVEWKR